MILEEGLDEWKKKGRKMKIINSCYDIIISEFIMASIIQTSHFFLLGIFLRNFFDIENLKKFARYSNHINVMYNVYVLIRYV